MTNNHGRSIRRLSAAARRELTRREALRLGVGLGAGAGLLSACGDNAGQSPRGSGQTGGGGPVSISTLDGPRDADSAVEAAWEDILVTFEEEHSGISISMNPKLPTEAMNQIFPAKLANGTMENLFTLPIAQAYIPGDNGRLANLAEQVADWEYADQLDEQFLAPLQSPDGQLYGFPYRGSYFGIMYNRAMFADAGLDPDMPPTTFEEFRACAAALTNTDDNRYGYAEMKGNAGPWHYSGFLYAAGGRVQHRADDGWTAGLTDDAATTALELLQAMRWEDESISPKLYKNLGEIFPEMVAGRIGMAISYPTFDGDATVYGGDPADIGFGPFPQGGGNATLIQGTAFLITANSSAEQVDAAFDWGIFAQMNPDTAEMQLSAEQDAGLTIPAVHAASFILKPDSALLAELQSVQETYATVAAGNSSPFFELSQDLEKIGEAPVESQKFYALMAPSWEQVLTEPDVDVGSLLAEVNGKIETEILGNQ